MENIAGSPVEGDNFYGRDAEIAHLREILRNDDVLLLGARRIGKTSIARAVMAKVRGEGGHAVEINVASCVDERDFLNKLDAALRPQLESLPAKTAGRIREALATLGGRIKSVKIPVPGAGSIGVDLGEGAAQDWTRVGSDVLSLIAEIEEPWLIYIDELPILLFGIIKADKSNGVSRVRRFLDWFRNDVRALPGAHKVRWLVSGSVGLDTLVQQHKMADTINSLQQEGLDAFMPDVARGMLAELASRYKLELTSQNIDSIVSAVQWPQPYYLQKTFTHLRKLIAENPGVAYADLIEQAAAKLTEPGTDNDFHHWEQRLALQLPDDDAKHGRVLLTLAASDPNGASATSLLACLEARMPADATQEDARDKFLYLRDILQRDGYWWPDDQSGARRYRFRLEPLRRWWNRKNTL